AEGGSWMGGAHIKQAASFLKEQMQPTPVEELKRIKQLVKELDSDLFETRSKAENALKMLGPIAGPALRLALEQGPALEGRQRLERLLTSSHGADWSKEALRLLRAFEALEVAATPEAEQVLLPLSRGPAEDWLTQEARATLERLEKQKRATR